MCNMAQKTVNTLTKSAAYDGKNTSRVLVLGLGNILLRDEGVGVHIAQKLQQMALPKNTEVIDGGTAGPDILLSQQKPYKLIIIDAVKAGQKPASVYKICFKAGEKSKFSEIFDRRPSNLSLHQTGLIDVLL